MQYRRADVYSRSFDAYTSVGLCLSGFNLELNRGRAKVSSNETPLLIHEGRGL